jgi:anti-sigma regulatory factor (Ser/Thr protein kinase)
LALPRSPHAASLARDAADRLTPDLPLELRARLRLVVSELVTNAVRHGEGAIELRLWRDGTAVRGEVFDEGGGFEHEARHDAWDDVSGRGLGIVERLTRRWGIREGTTHVWFELDPGGAARPAEPELG